MYTPDTRNPAAERELGELLLIQNEIGKIQDGIDTGDSMLEDIPAMAQSKSQTRIMEERDRVYPLVSAVLVANTGNVLGNRQGTLEHIFKAIGKFNNFGIYGIGEEGDELYERLVDRVPGFNFNAKTITIQGDQVKIYDDFRELQSFYIGDFYDSFVTDTE